MRPVEGIGGAGHADEVEDRETQVENASITITNNEASLADTRNGISAQINQAFASLSTAQETINVSTAARVAGDENLRVVTERYRDEAAFQLHQASAYGPPLFQRMRAIISIKVEYYDSVD